MSENLKTGIIIKGISGFYYVESENTVYECKARGIFRKEGITPLAGDRVKISIGANGKGWVEEISPRTSYLERPPVANVDRIFVVVSAADPSPSPIVIDRLVAIAEDKEIEPVIVFNKTDLANVDEYINIYKSAGFETYSVCCNTGEGVDALKNVLVDKINVFAGNSGVGKSSLLNLILPQYELKTGEISQKLGRGRHTTRHVELLKLENGGYVADTPGFASIDMEKQWIYKENLQFAFREFAPYIGECKFTSCSHTGEKGCAIGEAVEKGIISKSRHQNYITLYREMDEIKDWERNKE
ncbi:MAG: ribosome small subunit-dependent GTPase A [Clostridia bacterium]|nr:ribosome small subunit-dependent GTPase A [Clostridia bacterium]